MTVNSAEGQHAHDVTRQSPGDTRRHVTRKYMTVPGSAIAIAGTQGTGKTILAGDILYAYHVGEQWERGIKIPKELVLIRDQGTGELLKFTNYDVKMRVYVPEGCTFEPHKSQIKPENLDYVFFDPRNVWTTILDRLLDDDADQYMHIIQYDIFTKHKAHLMVVPFWHNFIVRNLVPWKDQHKFLNMVFFSDEFQEISSPRYRGTAKSKDKLALSQEITSSIISNFRKNGIRLIACFNPLKGSIDEHLRSQFLYFFLKHMTRRDLDDWTVRVATWTENCREDEVILLFNHAPEEAPDVDSWGWFDRIYWPLRFDLTSHEHRLHINAKAPDEFYELGGMDDVKAKQRIHPQRISYAMLYMNKKGIRVQCPDPRCGFHDRGFRYKMPNREIAPIFGYPSGQNVTMQVRNHPPTDEKLPKIGDSKLEVEPPSPPSPVEKFIEEATEKPVPVQNGTTLPAKLGKAKPLAEQERQEIFAETPSQTE